MWQKLWAQNDKNDQIDEQMSALYCTMLKHAKPKCMIPCVCLHTHNNLLLFGVCWWICPFRNDNNILVIQNRNIKFRDILKCVSFDCALGCVVWWTLSYSLDVNQIFKQRTAQWISLEIRLTHFSLNFPNARRQNALKMSSVDCLPILMSAARVSHVLRKTSNDEIMVCWAAVVFHFERTIFFSIL